MQSQLLFTQPCVHGRPPRNRLQSRDLLPEMLAIAPPAQAQFSARPSPPGRAPMPPLAHHAPPSGPQDGVNHTTMEGAICQQGASGDVTEEEGVSGSVLPAAQPDLSCSGCDCNTVLAIYAVAEDGNADRGTTTCSASQARAPARVTLTECPGAGLRVWQPGPQQRRGTAPRPPHTRPPRRAR